MRPDELQQLEVLIYAQSRIRVFTWKHEQKLYHRWVNAIWDKYYWSDPCDDWLEHRRRRIEAPRARRRRDKERMKRRAVWVATTIWGYRKDEHRSARKIADHIKVCSCWACGNQRHGHGMNMQETRERARIDAALFYENYDWYEDYDLDVSREIIG